MLAFRTVAFQGDYSTYFDSHGETDPDRQWFSKALGSASDCLVSCAQMQMLLTFCHCVRRKEHGASKKMQEVQL